MRCNNFLNLRRGGIDGFIIPWLLSVILTVDRDTVRVDLRFTATACSRVRCRRMDREQVAILTKI